MDLWDHLEWRAHALRQEFDCDDSCSLLASDRLCLGDDAGRLIGQQKPAAGRHRLQWLERP